MPMAVKQDIEMFLANLNQHIEIIYSYENELHQRILLLALLDTLAGFAFPKKKSSRKRFVKFIDSYSNWEGRNRVCLAYLQQLLNRAPSGSHLELKTEVEKRIKALEAGGEVSRILGWNEVDPSQAELTHFNTKKVQEKIEMSRYPSLLWDMRNFGVHEFRQAGADLLNGAKDEPYYIMVPEVSRPQQFYWYVVVPTKFISELASDCARTLGDSFKKRNINPYEIVPTGLAGAKVTLSIS
jgi:hypothetical protein